MSSPPRSAPDPFWLCHECGAQMRPIRIDGVPHCASCNGEFIEILDSQVNPDPFHELPPAPPVRPGASPPASRATSPLSDGGGGFMQSLFTGLMGMAGQEGQAGNHQMRQQSQQGGGQPGVWTFNIGNGTGSVMFGSFNGNNRGQVPGPFGQQGGLEAFFPGFAQPGTRMPGHRPGDPLAGQDLLRAIMAALEEDGRMPPGMFGPQGRMDTGDYVNSQHGFDQILEQLMQAAGPQGPLPASDVVIEGLPRFKLDETTLANSQFKDCPVCKDDFTVGEEVMRIPCKHIFHPDCLVPWLKTNGSCPVCRFSLVPDDENRRPAQSNPPANPSQPPRQQPAPAPSAGSDWQSTITSTLNRLFGQGGGPPSPTDERIPASAPDTTQQPNPSTGVIDYSTLNSASSPATQASAHSALRTDVTPSVISGEAAAPDPPSPTPPAAALQSSAIPEDYRERHRRREQEQQPYGDDLD